MKILIISPYYAPFSLVGANRMMSLSKYLEKNGHEVTVWAHDTQTLERLSGKENLHTPVPEEIKILRFSLRREKSNNRFLYPLFYRRQMSSCKKNAKKQLYKDKYDVIVLTCGPLYTETAIARLSQKRHIPLVMDMRDLNVLDGVGNAHGSIVHAIQTCIWKVQLFNPEKKSMKLATKIVGVVPAAEKQISDAYHVDKSKIEIIYNGYDDKLLEGVLPAEKSESVIRIGYFGKLMYYSLERAEILLKAVDILRREGRNIELFHVGPGGEEITRKIADMHLDPKVYNSIGTRNYREGMSLMMSADLYAIEHKDLYGLGTKIFDYLYCNKPILCVAPKETVLSQIVSKFENGFSTDSLQDTVFAIKTIIDNRLDKLETSFDPAKYSRSAQNQRYEELLLSICSATAHDSKYTCTGF